MAYDIAKYAKHVSADRSCGALLWFVDGGRVALIKARVALGGRRALTVEMEPATARSLVEVLNQALADAEAHEAGVALDPPNQD